MAMTLNIKTVRRRLASLSRKEILGEIDMTPNEKMEQTLLGVYRDGYAKAMYDVEKGVNP